MRLEGHRAIVRTWRFADLSSLVRHANDPLVAQQLRDRFPHPYTRRDGEAFLKYIASSGGDSNFAIEVNGEAAGGIGYHGGSDIERFSAEIGYWLSRAHWGRGIVSEALVLLTDHLFATRNLLRLFALPFADNAGSIRVLEKAGYVREGVLRSSCVKHGVPRDQVLYARVNDVWRLA